MTHARLLSAAGVIMIGILIIFFLSVPHAQEVATQSKTSTARATTTPVVTLSDAFANGTHTYSGTLVAPNACTTLSATALVSGDASSTPSVSLSLTYPADTGVCLELPTKTPFLTTLEAPKDATVTVSVNGVLASTSEL